MPENRPRPVRFNAAPRAKSRSPQKTTKTTKTAKRTPRAPKPSGGKDDSNLLIWIAAGLIVLLIGLVGLYLEAPTLRGWFAKDETPVQPEHPLEQPQPLSTVESETPKLVPVPAQPHVVTPVPPKPTVADEHVKSLKERADEETRLLVERPIPTSKTTVVPPPSTVTPPVKPVVPATAAAQPPPVIPPTTPPVATDNEPPLAKPVPVGQVTGAPVRALPLDPNKLDTERIAAYQVALERIHFSCGFVDGDQGMRTQRMLKVFQASRGLPVTGFLDQPTRDAIREPGEPFLNYTVTADDVASIMPKPAGWLDKSKATRLGYNDIWEMLGEKFHCTRAYLKALNHGVKTPVAGTEMIGPKVYPAAPIPKVASLRISLGETYIEALDASGKAVGFFPCSIAKDKNKRPNGALFVKSVVPNPDYTFDPALFADAAKAEGLTKKMVLPPGPRNPVGVAWIGLSLPGYGIHGTPEPENISRTQSHGCFRLANWNAEKVLKMVKVGTPIDVEP